jgi:hypothetical protein
VQVNHSELLASPMPSQESQLNEYGDVGARRGGGRKKDPQTWFANLDASTAAAFCANHSTFYKNLTAIAAFAGPAAGAAGRSQENLVLCPLLRRSTPGLILDKGPRGGPGAGGAGRHLRTPPLPCGVRRLALSARRGRGRGGVSGVRSPERPEPGKAQGPSPRTTQNRQNPRSRDARCVVRPRVPTPTPTPTTRTTDSGTPRTTDDQQSAATCDACFCFYTHSIAPRAAGVR